jgi:hypothetical protein
MIHCIWIFQKRPLANSLKKWFLTLMYTYTVFPHSQQMVFFWCIQISSLSHIKKFTSCLPMPVIENFIWIEPLSRGHLPYKVTFSLSKGDLLTQVWLYLSKWRKCQNSMIFKHCCSLFIYNIPCYSYFLLYKKFKIKKKELA